MESSFRIDKPCDIYLDNDSSPAFSSGGMDSLLTAALKAGLGFPYECQSGSCGSCRFKLLDGEVHDRWPDAPGLQPDAKAAGYKLGCQTVARSDCRIKVRLKNAYVPPLLPRRYRARLERVRQLTHDMREFQFSAAGPADFLPGQYAMLGLQNIKGMRAYSMSNLPNPDGQWSFVIKRTPGGAATGALFDTVSPGEIVELEGPFGNAYLRANTGRDIVCIGGGSGLSPMLSIVRAVASTPSIAEQRIFMFYGAREPRDHCIDLIFETEPALAQRVKLFSAISEDDSSDGWQWKGQRGFIHEVVNRRRVDLNPAECDFYFCGPPVMTDAIQRLLLLEWRVPSDQLHFDRFQ